MDDEREIKERLKEIIETGDVTKMVADLYTDKETGRVMVSWEIVVKRPYRA